MKKQPITRTVLIAGVKDEELFRQLDELAEKHNLYKGNKPVDVTTLIKLWPMVGLQTLIEECHVKDTNGLQRVIALAVKRVLSHETNPAHLGLPKETHWAFDKLKSGTFDKLSSDDAGQIYGIKDHYKGLRNDIDTPGGKNYDPNWMVNPDYYPIIRKVTASSNLSSALSEAKSIAIVDGKDGCAYIPMYVRDLQRSLFYLTQTSVLATNLENHRLLSDVREANISPFFENRKRLDSPEAKALASALNERWKMFSGAFGHYLATAVEAEFLPAPQSELLAWANDSKDR